jgi:hypothetical protein
MVSTKEGTLYPELVEPYYGDTGGGGGGYDVPQIPDPVPDPVIPKPVTATLDPADTEPTPTPTPSTPIAPPYTDAEIYAWDCPTLAAKLQEVSQIMMQSRFTAEAAQVWEATRAKMQMVYNADCVVSQPQAEPEPAENQSPIARAGNAITIKLPVNMVELDGSASSDPEAGPLTFSWNQTAGPSTAQIMGADRAMATVSGLIEGYYSFRLTVFDVLGASNSATVNVTVQPASVVAPVDTPPTPVDVIDPAPVPPIIQTTVNTAPISNPGSGPYGAGGGGGGGGSKGKDGPIGTADKKTDWFKWAVIAWAAAGIAYIAFAKND